MSSPVQKVKKTIKKTINKVVGIANKVVNVASKIVTSVFSFVTQPFMGLLGGFAAPDIPSASSEIERQQGVLLQRQGSVVSVPVVYGHRKVGGVVTFAETGDTNNRYLWVAYVFSEGPVEGLHEIYIDDHQISAKHISNLNSGTTVNIDDGKYSGRVQLQFFHGAHYATATSSPVGTNSILADAPSWDTNMNYNGLCVMFARYEFKEIKTQEDADNNPFGASIPVLQATLLGRKVASLTITSPENFDYDDDARYSTNPAEILLDYLRHPRYGKGLTNDQIDWASWKTAAAKCNTTVQYIADNTQGPILSCNYVLDTGQTIFNNTKNLLMGFRAYMPYVQGKYKLKIEDAGNPTDITSSAATIELIAVADGFGKAEYSTDTADIIGDINYARTDRSARYNQVTVTYVEPDKKWVSEQVVYPESESDRATLITEDGGNENKLEVAFPTLTNYAMAKDMARLLLNKSRLQDSVSLRITAEALELEPGDNIRIQARKLNFGNTAWRVISIKYNNDMTADIACVRNAETIYPYTIVGQEDIVSSPYIPKGSTIYYPAVGRRVAIGLVPPKNATISTTPVDTVVNPVPTDPTGSTGGGGGNTATPTTNTPPTPPQQVEEPLDATVDVFQVTYTKEGENYFANLNFAQPVANYGGTVFYFKRNVGDTKFRVYESTDAPGIGETVTATIGPLSETLYKFVSVVKYSTGERSVQSASFSLTPQAGSADPTETINLTESLDLTEFTYASGRRDTRCEVRALGPVLNDSGGVLVPQPGDRYVNICVGQSLDQPINPDIIGIRITYRQSGTDYWAREDVVFDKSWFPSKREEAVPSNLAVGVADGFLPNAYGHTFRWEPSGTGLGTTQYPSSPGSTDNYDFMFMWLYNDGTPSTVHTRFMSVGVERDFADRFSSGTRVYNMLNTYTPTYEAENAFDYTLTSLSPPTASATGATGIKFGFVNWRIERFNANNTAAQLSIVVTQPNASDLSKWFGAYIEYRMYGQNGTNTPLTLPGYLGGGDISTAYVSRQVTSTQDLAALNQIRYEIPVFFPFDETFEIRVTPFVSDDLSVSIVPFQATNGIYGKGRVFRDKPGRIWTDDQITTEEQYTATQWNNTRITSAFVDPNPVVQLIEAYVKYPYYGSYPPAGHNKFDYAHHYIEWNHNLLLSSDYKGIRVYARANAGDNRVDQGPWEYWDVIDSNASGTVSTKLRLPVSVQYYWKDKFNKTVSPKPYGIMRGLSQFTYNSVMDVAIRVIRQDDSLSDAVQLYTYKIPGFIPNPKQYTQYIPISGDYDEMRVDFEDLNGFTDEGTQNLSQLNIEEAIPARADTGSSASTNDFIDPGSGQAFYIKRWT